MDELTQRVAAAGCPPTDWQAPGITPSPVGRTYTQSELDAAVAAERERWERELGAVMPADFKDWHQNGAAERPAVASWVIRNLRDRANSLRVCWLTRKTGLTSELRPPLAVGLERRVRRAAPKRGNMSMRWTEKRPTEGGFYYWQDGTLRGYSDDAVRVVQVSKYKNRDGFHCETLTTAGSWGPTFNCDLGKEPPGWWAGPLPQPYR